MSDNTITQSVTTIEFRYSLHLSIVKGMWFLFGKHGKSGNEKFGTTTDQIANRSFFPTVQGADAQRTLILKWWPDARIVPEVQVHASEEDSALPLIEQFDRGVSAILAQYAEKKELTITAIKSDSLIAAQSGMQEIIRLREMIKFCEVNRDKLMPPPPDPAPVVEPVNKLPKNASLVKKASAKLASGEKVTVVPTPVN